MSGPSGQYPLADLLECAGLARSSYYYALSHPKAPTRPELWEAAAEIFSRTANGCGHRQIAMCLRAEQGVRIADKTTLKMMREMGISCGIRRETDYHRYNSHRGKVGKTFENVIGRDFAADGPWEKMGTDVTEFKQPWGKAYFAPVYDFGSKEIVAWSTLLASIYFSPFSPTYFRQSRQRGCAGFAYADAPLSASRLPPPSRPHRRWIRPSGGTTVPLS